MKEAKRRRSLSGAVLIMILTVMFVLIILLTATLTTVTTANQRIYTKYEENQAYYTARSALDVFSQYMLSDANYIAQDSGNRQYKYGNNDTVDMKQGLGLQLDLYSITAQSGHNVKQSNFTSYANNVTGSDDAKDEYLDNFGVEPSGTAINEIVYEIEFPKLSDDNFGKLSDLDSGVSKAKIKVEVLERKYNLGSYTNGGVETPVPEADVEDFINKTGSYTTVTDDMIAEAIATGNRKKDTMRVKITATTIFDGVEGTAVLILDSNEPPVNNSSRAITAFGSALGTNHAYIVGGMSMVGTPGSDIPWSNGGGVYGTVYNEAGLDFNVATPIFLTESEYLFIAGDLKGTNGVAIQADVTDTDKNKRPFIYVGGSVLSGNFSSVGGGAPTQKVDMIVHGINWTGNNFVVNGDIYSDGSCTFNSTAATPNISGDLYIKGDLIVGGNVASDSNGDGIPEVNLGPCNIFVSGNIIYNSSYYIPTLVANNGGGTISQYTFTSTNMSIPNINDVTDVTSGDLNVEVILPGSVKKQIDTHKTNYDNYYVLDEHGNYVDVDSDGYTPDRQTAMDMAGVDFTQASFTPADTLASAGTDIDVPSGTTARYLFSSSSNNGTYKITGGGTVELVMGIEYNPWWMPSDCTIQNVKIIADDDTTVKVYGGNSGMNYSLDKVSIWTETVYDAYSNGTTLNVGNQTGHNIKVPKIFYYFSGGEVSLNNSDSFLTGYFFGPTTKLTANAGSSITFSDLKYNGASVPSGWRYTVLGSVLCDDFLLQNDHGIIYINPDLDDDTPGEPIHQWKSYQYVRS